MMKTADNNRQRKFFDQSQHRFPAEKMLDPLPQHRQELSHVKKHIRISPPKYILDFGSGSGRFSIPLLQMGFHVHAVDISRVSLAAIQKVYKKHKSKSWGQLTVSTDIPKKKTFDMIFGGDILHHVPISTYLQQFFQILKPGGLLVFSEPNAWHLFWYIYYLLFVSWDVEKGILNLTKQNIKKEFGSAGFHDLTIEGHGLLPTPMFNLIPSLSSLNVKLGNLPIINNFAFRFIISARK